MPLDIAFTVCVSPGYLCGDVKQALLETFSNQLLSNGQLGFFHPNRHTIGQPIYLSQLVVRAIEVPGVRYVGVACFTGGSYAHWPSVVSFRASLSVSRRLHKEYLVEKPKLVRHGKLLQELRQNVTLIGHIY
jgi:hypothetical protein